jgi:hypothetical protein
VGQPQKHSRESFFRGGSQQMRNVILVVLDARQQICHQRIRGLIPCAKYLEHLFFFDGSYGTGGQRNGRGHAKGIARKAQFAKKITHAQDRGNCGRLMFRLGGEANSALLNVEEGVGWHPLLVDVLLFPII